MKKTLLELVQAVCNDLDFDFVTSWKDTEESEQIGYIVRQAWENMISTREWSQHSQLIDLSASGDNLKPTHMTLPSNIESLDFINYDKKTEDEPRIRYEKIHYKLPEEFLRLTNQEDSESENVLTVIDYTGIKLLIRNDQNPQYWTSFDDDHIVFNSYNFQIENTLQTSKVQAMAFLEPVFTMEDTFIPDLPSKAFSALQAEATSISSLRLKQMADEKAEMQAQKSHRWLSRKDWKAAGGIVYQDYGRKTRKGKFRQPMDKEQVVIYE
jgi:predicted ATP-dependent protease